MNPYLTSRTYQLPCRYDTMSDGTLWRFYLTADEWWCNDGQVPWIGY